MLVGLLLQEYLLQMVLPFQSLNQNILQLFLTQHGLMNVFLNVAHARMQLTRLLLNHLKEELIMFSEELMLLKPLDSMN